MLPDNWFWLVLFSFASFRLTRLLVYDKIMRFVRVPFIEEVEVPDEEGTVVTYTRIKGSGLQKWMGELLSCYWCTGVWVTAGLLGLYYWLPIWTEPLLYLLAIAGIAALIEMIVSKLSNE